MEYEETRKAYPQDSQVEQYLTAIWKQIEAQNVSESAELSAKLNALAARSIALSGARQAKQMTLATWLLVVIAGLQVITGGIQACAAVRATSPTVIVAPIAWPPK